MKNYRSSDYAVNKHAKGIVYRGRCHTREVTLEDFLAENPGAAERDFHELKFLSDVIYHQQDRDEYNQTRLNVPMEAAGQLATPALEDEIIHRQDGRQALAAARRLLQSGALTEVQRRRFFLHIAGGLSTRQIARREGVSQWAVCKSIQGAVKKLKKIFWQTG